MDAHEISEIDFWTNILLIWLVYVAAAAMLGLTLGGLLAPKAGTTLQCMSAPCI